MAWTSISVIDIYSRYGFDSIDPATCAAGSAGSGLYTQRKPGIDGGKTACSSPKIRRPLFMLRIRIDGGQLDQRAAPGDR